jgi:hypothetical protein
MQDRLVPSPVFILSPPRSGSTLLRCIAGSHPRVHAPHELHLADLRVVTATRMGDWSLDPLGLDTRATQYLLWDRLLHRELQRSGKNIIVEKTPQHVFIWERLLECWPRARFVFLLRHPGQVVRSAADAAKSVPLRTRLPMGLGFVWDGIRHGWENNPLNGTDQLADGMRRLDKAREALPGLTVRYEELTADPEPVVRELCDFLDVPYDPAMLSYGDFDHGTFALGIGDWREKIHSGRIQPSAPPPSLCDTPKALQELTVRWGYADAAADTVGAGKGA